MKHVQAFLARDGHEVFGGDSLGRRAVRRFLVAGVTGDAAIDCQAMEVSS